MSKTSDSMTEMFDQIGALVATLEPSSRPAPLATPQASDNVSPVVSAITPQPSVPALPPDSLDTPATPPSAEPKYKEKRGWKNRSHDRKETVSLGISFMKDDVIWLEQLQRQAGMNRSDIIRTLLKRARLPDPEERAMLADARQNLARVGSNLNQIAHALNAGESPVMEHIESAVKEVTSAVKILKTRI